jgi:hypothetical protein
MPQNYLPPLFASRLVRGYVFQFGLKAIEVYFCQLIEDLNKAN